MDGVSGLLPDLGPDVLAHPQDVAGSAHPHQAPRVGDAVKGGSHLDSALTE